MSRRVIDDVLAECQLIGRTASEVSNASHLARKICEKHTSIAGSFSIDGLQIWDHFNNASAIYDQNGCNTISKFLSEQDDKITYMLIADYHGYTAVQFECTEDICPVLQECVGFVFYITNESLNYVICLNDHDVLIGVGLAKTWIQPIE